MFNVKYFSYIHDKFTNKTLCKWKSGSGRAVTRIYINQSRSIRSQPICSADDSTEDDPERGFPLSYVVGGGSFPREFLKLKSLIQWTIKFEIFEHEIVCFLFRWHMAVTFLIVEFDLVLSYVLSWVSFSNTNELINIYTYILILDIAYIITCWGLFVDKGNLEHHDRWLLHIHNL